MTVAQWQRTSRWTGRFWKDEPLLPAHAVSWDDCVATMERAGLFFCLPTGAQWEYGCRAGTTTPWWTGATADTLRGAANIVFDPKDDQQVRPIGQLRANPSGLHDGHGNVWEWIRDEYGVNPPVRQGDGEPVTSGARFRLYRGGGFGYDAERARVGPCVALVPGDRDRGVGLRPARRVSP